MRLALTSKNALRIPFDMMPFGPCWSVWFNSTDKTIMILPIGESKPENYVCLKKQISSSRSTSVLIYLKNDLKKHGIDITDFIFKLDVGDLDFLLITMVSEVDDLLADLEKEVEEVEEVEEIHEFKVGDPVTINATVSYVNSTKESVDIIITSQSNTIENIPVAELTLRNSLKPGDHLMGIDGSIFMIVAGNDHYYPIAIICIDNHKFIDAFKSVESAMEELNLKPI